MLGGNVTALKTVGWIGVGKLGSPMVRTLLNAGYQVTIVEPLLENRASAVAAGAYVAESIHELISKSDLIVTTVGPDEVLHEIFFGDGGLAQHLRPDQIYVDLSTVSPLLSAEIASKLNSLSIDYLRAPVSGSTESAQSAQLTVMVSGPKPAWLAVQSILGCFSAKQFWVGEGDEARYLKLALNVLASGTSALLGEALAIGRNGGVSLGMLLEVICDSVVASPLLELKRELILTDDYEPTFSVAQMIHDLELVKSIANKAGLENSITKQVWQRLEKSRLSGLENEDFFVLVRDYIT
eukprot:gene15620-15768_t